LVHQHRSASCLAAGSFELMAKAGKYAELFNLQAKGYV
jgi:hypothetical protein